MNEAQESKLIKMLRMQDGFNVQVNENWRAAGYNFMLAAELEAVEAIDHLDWKWWKHGKNNIPQFKLELVDIWHFLLSEVIVNNENDTLNLLVATFCEGMKPKEKDYQVDTSELIAVMRKFIKADSLANAIGKFLTAVNLVGMTFEELYGLYVGKSTLNTFRQDHGYKTGDYVKVWNGLEDNEHLFAIIAATDLNQDTFTVRAAIYAHLEAAYPI